MFPQFLHKKALPPQRQNDSWIVALQQVQHQTVTCWAKNNGSSAIEGIELEPQIGYLWSGDQSESS
jgi:hypothetical protein